MNTKIIRRIDKQGRLNLKADLMEMCEIHKGSKLAMCKLDETRIMIRNMNNIKGCKVNYIIRTDDKGRIIIPLEVRKDTTNFEIYAIDGILILEEAH